VFIRLYWANSQIWMRAGGFVQLSKSSQAHLIREKNVLVMDKILYDKEQTHFPKQHMWGVLLTNERKI